MEDSLKDYYRAGRAIYEKARGEENAAMKQASSGIQATATATTSLTDNLKGAKEAMQSLMDKLRGTASGGGGEGGGNGSAIGNMGRRRIVSHDAATSSVRQFMRLSPRAMGAYDGSFDAFFNKGKKVGPELAYQNFMKQNRGTRAGVMGEMQRRASQGPPPAMDLMSQTTRANGRAFGGLSGRNGDGKGNTNMEQLLKEIAKNTEGLKAK